MARWDLYRALAEPLRLRLLALVNEEELAIGELAMLTGEGQPNVSRHAALLKTAGLVAVQKQGQRSLLRIRDDAKIDPVVVDALASGRALCVADGSLARIADVLAERDAVGREYFARTRDDKDDKALDAQPPELAAYLSALAFLLPRRTLAVDVGTGDGSLLEVLAPCFDNVVAVDQSPAQLALAKRRVAARRFTNVTLAASGSDELINAGLVAPGSADAVFAVRVLHHAPKPAAMLAQLHRLCAPGGALILLDYGVHDDESMRERADLWLGFSSDDLIKLAVAAGFVDVHVANVPSPSRGPDAHLPWHVMVAKRPAPFAA